MNPRSVWAVWFSATGATEQITRTMASHLAQRMGLPLKTHNFTLPPAREQHPAFSQGDLVVFGTPVYAGRVPNVLLPYISSLQGGGALAVPVVLYGNRAFDDALMELRNLLEAGGFRTVAGCAFVGEHSFGRSLAAGRPDDNDLKTALYFADGIFEKLSHLDANAGHVPVTVPGNNPVGPYFRPTDANGDFIDIRRVKPVTGEDCIDCKLCAESCPMGSIDYDTPREMKGICIKCNACVKLCPVGAKHFEDPAYLFHRDDILSRYAFPRKEPALFL